ncbi:MAG: hypothetical protein KAS70_04775 [Planctomycetes bacterium]|nr:hypothetical protein [Planctomycetota bacterium]
MTWFGRLMEKIGRIANHIRSAGFVLLLIFFLLSLVKHGCNRNEIADLIERTTGLNLQNDILHNHVEERDSLLIEKQALIDTLEADIVKSEYRVGRLSNQYTRLQDEFNSLSDSLITIPADSSYSFLDRTAYPYEGEKRFPFSAPQVKGIHLTWMERISLAGMNTSLKGTISELNSQLLLRDSVQIESSGMLIMMEASAADLELIIDNKDEVIDAQQDHIEKKKKGNRILQYIGGGIIIILAILAAGGG